MYYKKVPGVESSEQGKTSIERVDDKPSREYVQLELKCNDLNNKVLSMTEELLKLKIENHDLRIQLQDISTSVANNFKSSDKKERQLWNANSTRINETAKDETRNIREDEDKDIKSQRKLKLTNQINTKAKGLEQLFDFKANISSDDNLLVYLKRRFYKQSKTNGQTRFIPWLWECRGIPRI